ncbi:unnamed protein product [Parajaminaea phylloscopi]
MVLGRLRPMTNGPGGEGGGDGDDDVQRRTGSNCIAADVHRTIAFVHQRCSTAMLRLVQSSSRSVTRAALTASKAPAAAPSAAIQRRFASGGGSYNEPTGSLFGEKPLKKGEKRKREDWELIWYFGMFGGIALAVVTQMYKPDTSIQSWAMPAAKKNLEESGRVWKYEPSPNSGHPNGV